MASEHVLSVGDSDFESTVLNSDQPVLVDFWAVWCGPCKAIGPVVDKLAGEFEGRVRVAKVNVDEAQQTALRFHVRSIPTLLLFKGGEVVELIVGVVPESKLRTTLESAI